MGKYTYIKKGDEEGVICHRPINVHFVECKGFEQILKEKFEVADVNVKKKVIKY